MDFEDGCEICLKCPNEARLYSFLYKCTYEIKYCNAYQYVVFVYVSRVAVASLSRCYRVIFELFLGNPALLVSKLFIEKFAFKHE